MGTPCSKNSKSKHGQRNVSNDPSSSSERQETLKFKVEIGNIKARNLPPASSYINIDFAKQRKVRTPEVSNAVKNYSWKLHEEFEYKCTRNELKQDEIVLTLMNTSDKEIGTVTINLYDVATGPSHQDFVIKMKKKKIEPGRLSFYIKMSQIIHLVIKPKLIHCKMTSNLREKSYNFSLRMNTKEREFASEHSTDFINMPTVGLEKPPDEQPVDENYQHFMDENKKVKMKYFAGNKVKRNFQKMRPEDRECDAETSETSKFDEDSMLQISKTQKPVLSKIPSVLLEKKMSAFGNQSLAWAPKKEMVWTYQEDEPSRIFIEMDTNLRELATGTFQFFLWANKETGQNQSVSDDSDSDFSNDKIYIDHKLVGECFIGMNRFFFGDDEATLGEIEIKDKDGNAKSFAKRITKLSDKLLFHGEHIGEVTAEFMIKNSSFFKQMIFGIRTEEGIQKSSSLYLKSDRAFPTTAKNTDIKEIKTLRQLKESLKNSSFNLFEQKANPKARIKYIDELATNMIKVLDILKTSSSHQESSITILYKTPENLMLSQKIFIGLTKHALDNCDEVPNSLRPVYYETLLMLINRAEFDLNYMGFDESYEEFLNNAQKTIFKSDAGGSKIDLKNIQQKLKVCESYQSLLYHMLQKVLSKLSQKGLPDKEREFVEQFIAIAYFRIPEFREKLLNGLKKDIANIPIPEWRGQEWKFEQSISYKMRDPHLFTAMFDWEKSFYVYLKNTEEGESNAKLLTEILEDRDWKNRLAKRGSAFYSFLNEWAKHVNKTVVTKDHVPWQDLPGYTTLVKTFLIEMKAKDVRRYPSSLINASYALLKNEKLLNVFIPIIYNKTRIYESFNVFAVFELINNWFGVLRENKKTIEATFDNAYFVKGIVLVLEGDHALNIAKVLWMIYNNFDVFSYALKEQLSQFFFGNIFFKLFLHWSWIVRHVFHHLLIYRFYHQHRTSNTNLTNLNDLKKELLMYNQKRENFSKTKEMFVNGFINMEYSRYMTIIENAYKKLQQERAQRHMRGKASWESVKKPNYTKKTSIIPEVNENDPNQKGPPLILPEEESGRKEEYFPRLRLQLSSSEKQDVESNVVDDFFDTQGRAPRKQSLPVTGETSYWLINPDNLEVSIQGPNRISRSESMNLTPTNKRGSDINQPDAFNFLDSEIPFKSTDDQGPKRSRNSQTKKSIPSLQDDDGQKDKKKVIHRRLMYFDKQTNKLKEIPKECAMYLEYAYKEYETIKEQYVKWFSDFQQSLIHLSEEQARKLKGDPKVPELIVKIPLDEDGQMDMEEW